MFTLKIKTDNAAFGDYPQEEIRSILNRVIDRLDIEDGGSIMDSNGNRVGEWSLTLD